MAKLHKNQRINQRFKKPKTIQKDSAKAKLYESSHFESKQSSTSISTTVESKNIYYTQYKKLLLKDDYK